MKKLEIQLMESITKADFDIKNFELILKKLDNKDFVNKNFHTPLITAAIYGNRIATIKLLDYGASTEKADNKGKTPLMYAIEQGNYAVAQILLERECDVNAQMIHSDGKKGYAAIHFLAEKGSIKGLKMLVKFKPNLDLLSAKHNMTACDIAAKSFYNLFLAYMIIYKAQDRQFFRYALQNTFVALLAKSKNDKDLRAYAREEIGRAIYTLIENGTIEQIKELIHDGAYLKIKNEKKNSLLHHAIINDNYFAIETLVKKCPELLILQDKDGDTPLHLAAIYKDHRCAHMLIKKLKKTVYSLPLNKSMQSPYSIACKNADARMISLLESNKLALKEDMLIHELQCIITSTDQNVNDLERIGEIVAKLGNPDVIFHGIHLDTPLTYAALLGKIKIVSLMLNLGANIHYIDAKGATALFLASYKKRVEVVHLLLHMGAKAGVYDQNDQSSYVVNAIAKYASDEPNDLYNVIMAMLVYSGANRVPVPSNSIFINAVLSNQITNEEALRLAVKEIENYNSIIIGDTDFNSSENLKALGKLHLAFNCSEICADKWRDKLLIAPDIYRIIKKLLIESFIDDAKIILLERHDDNRIIKDLCKIISNKMMIEPNIKAYSIVVDAVKKGII